MFACVPVAALFVAFALAGHLEQIHWDPWPRGYWHRFAYPLSWMKSYSYSEFVPAVAVCGFIVVASVGLIVWRVRQSRFTVWGSSAWLIAAVAVGYLFLIAPDSPSGGAMLLVRLPEYGYLALVLWLAAQPLGSRSFQRLRLVTTCVAASAFAWLLVSSFLSYVEVNSYLREFDVLADIIPSGSTVARLPLEDSVTYAIDSTQVRNLMKGVDPFHHAPAIGLAEHGVIDLADYWATTDHQSLRWRPRYRLPNDIGIDITWDLAAFERRTGRAVDYVVVWQGHLPLANLWDESMVAQVRPEHYKLIYTSPHSGYLNLYKRVESSSSVELAESETRGSDGQSQAEP